MKCHDSRRRKREEEIRNIMKNSLTKNYHAGLSGPLQAPGRFLTLPHVLKYLSCPGNALNYVPLGNKDNMFFVVNNSVCPWKIHKGGLNIFHDDCGEWNRCRSSKVMTCIGNVDGSWKTIVSSENKFYEKSASWPPLDPQPDMNNVVKIHRYYTTLKTNGDYRRRITILSGTGFKDDKALIEYCDARPKKRRKVVCQDYGVTDTFNEITEDGSAGDTYEDEYAISENSHQVHNVEDVAFQKIPKELMSRMLNEKHAILTMLTESPGVQAVINRKDQAQCIILYSEEQMSDMKRNLECDSVLGVDCTHKFGDCYITMTVYQNFRALHKDTNEPLLFLGPVYLHWDEEFLTYVSFFSHIMDKLEGVEPNVEVKLGSDIGLSLFKALKFSFPASTHILDSHHLKETVNRELYDVCEGKAEECSIISKKMFGLKGLTSSPTLFIFRKRLSELAPYFEEFPKLRTYFIKMKVILYEYFCEPLQKGVYPKLWGGCREEALSSHLQSLFHLNSYELPVLVKKICTISNLQMQYLEDRYE